ncbi:hypothetical protein, partial [Vibrio vulnificus]|uniref:hypothetical protein n=1 Tax=Vibrio vulnificus TaxID=672 RepID=UPI0019D49364
LARRAYHFQQLASSSTPFHECRTYYLKSGVKKLKKNDYKISKTDESCRSNSFNEQKAVSKIFDE